MIINVGDYVERYANDYIVYHSGHFSHKYGDLAKANRLFDERYKEARASLGNDALEKQVKAVQATVDATGQDLPGVLNLDEALRSGDLLERTLDEIAKGINEGIQDYYNNFDFQAMMKSGKKYNKLLSKGHASATNMDRFFTALLDALQTVSRINQDFITELNKLGTAFTGKRYYLNQNIRQKYVNTSRAVPISAEDKALLDRVLKALQEAKERFANDSYVNKKGKTINKKEGMLSAQSFSSTINHIFSVIIGEELDRTMINNGILKALEQAEGEAKNEFQKMLKDGTIRIDKIDGMLTGSRTAKGSEEGARAVVSKVDILHNGMIQLQVIQNGDTYIVEIGLGTSSKWYKGGINAKSQIHMVAGSPLEKYFDHGTEWRYLGYNVIAHRFSDQYSKNPAGYHDAYRRVRAATAASFFNDWMTGSGNRIQGTTGIDRVQLLMVNGKVYSVMRIIRNICDELMQLDSTTESENMPFSLSVPESGANKWEGPPRRPHMTYARKRSRLVNGVMDKLTISSTLNGGILTKYAY